MTDVDQVKLRVLMHGGEELGGTMLRHAAEAILEGLRQGRWAVLNDVNGESTQINPAYVVVARIEQPNSGRW